MCEEDNLTLEDYNRVCKNIEEFLIKHNSPQALLESEAKNLIKIIKYIIQHQDSLVLDYKSFLKKISELSEKIYNKIKNPQTRSDFRNYLEDLLFDIYNIFVKEEISIDEIINKIKTECKRLQEEQE